MGESANSAALLLGLSGPSSSGKTTLARLLRDILPNTSILHIDDFYKTDKDIPVNEDGLQDWDCLDSLDLPLLTSTLEYIKEHGRPPTNFISKEDQNEVGESGVSEKTVVQFREEIQHVCGDRAFDSPIVIIDGFLLYSDIPPLSKVTELLDVKLFLHNVTYQTVKRRREARKGYVTLEGFWEDPPGYVDKIVWPNYVKDHKFLFYDGDVEGRLNEEVCKELGIRGMPERGDNQISIQDMLEWALAAVKEDFRQK
ncbi:P-loop containing nucleoside triphosphate hydrolase protein [Patellaria atrata CBS 101060]|uniref:P-loop containing nucleoside triphosphate hydrolase protein n=1 Tax=Patellaria atrata CBS 101060 TaxID=1346257 RepID=A0A9P4S1K2_9PEZI|nr:P-loop containing nucleoside triphosphate hydrolase protein [Patellaria atrata CBS 101060]